MIVAGDEERQAWREEGQSEQREILCTERLDTRARAA